MIGYLATECFHFVLPYFSCKKLDLINNYCMETNTIELKRKEWLIDLLTEKTSANQSYSLRALARDTGISVAVISRILSGKRNFTLNLANRVIENLKLESDASKKLLSLYSHEAENSTVKNYQLESFKAMSDWRHYALIKLMDLAQFKEDSKSLASILKTTELNVIIIIERLIFLDVIERNAEGLLIRTGNNLIVDAALVEKANLKLQKSIVEKMDEDFNDWIKEGEFNSMTLAINSENLIEAKKEIKRFKRRMIEILSQGQKDKVVNFNISICPYN